MGAHRCCPELDDARALDPLVPQVLDVILSDDGARALRRRTMSLEQRASAWSDEAFAHSSRSAVKQQATGERRALSTTLPGRPAHQVCPVCEGDKYAPETSNVNRAAAFWLPGGARRWLHHAHNGCERADTILGQQTAARDVAAAQS